MKTTTLLLAGLICAAPLAATAQINVGIGINLGGLVRESPPPPQVERMGPAPGPDYVFIHGHWSWHGRWVWERGHWDRRPGYRWMEGHWDRHDGGYVWVEGRWDVFAPPPPAYGPPPPPAYGPPPPPMAGAEVVIVNEPPPPQIEHFGPAPGPDFFWIGGRWEWHGRWVWTHGHYERHPHFHQGGAWIAGHWDHRPNGFVWVEGYWR